MSEHYFSNNPRSKSMPKTWSYQLRDKKYTFTSDIGVFSKGEVDFGTRLLIETFEEPTIAGDFLDLGCGYGPIGISLADFHKDRSIVMVDVNERAVDLTKQNAINNAVNNVEVKYSDRFSTLDERNFAAILINPPIRAGKDVVHKMFEESKLALLEQGELWIVVQKKQGAPSTMNKLEALFGNVDLVTRKKGYFILRAVNV